MNKKKLQVILLVVLVVSAISATTIYRMWNKPHDVVEDKESFVTTISQLSTDFETDEDVANQKYLNQAIEIKGVISETETNQDGKLVIILSSEDASLDVQCTMRDNDISANTGNNVTIKGFCTGSNLFGVLLTDCILK